MVQFSVSRNTSGVEPQYFWSENQLIVGVKNMQKINIEKTRKTIKRLDPQVLAHCVRNTEMSKKLVLTEFLKFQKVVMIFSQ